MQNPSPGRAKAHIAAATAGQTPVLEDATHSTVSQKFAETALARRTRQTLRTRTCPHCQSNDILLHGNDQNERQRFKCRGCRRTYNILTGTPMARARMPEKWGQYLDCMTRHVPLRQIVATGIGVHLVTAWRWRHRFLQAAANDNAPVLSGVIEADETFFPRSFKGSRAWKAGDRPEDRAARRHGRGAKKRRASRDQVPVLTALDSGDSIFQAILASLSGIEAALEGRIAAGSVLCSNDNPAYINVADRANLEHVLVTASGATHHVARKNPVAMTARKPGRLGLRRVNDHHQRLRYLIDEKCRGVATKYLGNYLGWHRAMTRPGFEGRTLLALALA